VPITIAHSFLVRAGKADETQQKIGGVKVPLDSKVGGMLAELFTASAKECDIDIMFRNAANGSQSNPVQKILESYAHHPSLPNGRTIAEQLQAVTTHRSGLGLLFVACGADSVGPRLLVARFPADSGVVAHERSSGLTVEFLDRVFMKNARAYKSVFYVARRGFWDGKAVDKQTESVREISEYWINEFLQSDLRTTSQAGSRRLADALRKATQSADDNLRVELMSAAQVIRSQPPRPTSILKIMTDLNLSADAIDAVSRTVGRKELLSERFKFDRNEYDLHIGLRMVALDNGATLMADNTKFEQVFKPTDQGDGRTRFSTEGVITDQRLRKSSQ
jgi:hypothetical protein